LSQANQQALQLRFHRTVQHLLAETIGRALLMGVALGLIAYLVAGFNPVLVGLVGVFAGLLPIVGPAFVWLPLASLLASKGRWTEASALVAASWSASWLIERLSQRLARALGTDDTLLSFLLFCSIVGGVLGSGMRGLILGPAAVIVVVVLAQFVASLYGQDRQQRQAERDAHCQERESERTRQAQEHPRAQIPQERPSTGIPSKP
jgi:predicted PurR-regulated permease PerM